jgi:hypothetical protein
MKRVPLTGKQGGTTMDPIVPAASRYAAGFFYLAANTPQQEIGYG